MAPASENPDTLRGYDIVLSLSQEAINAQFRELYHKPLPVGRVPPPRGLKGFQPAPPPQYYINHNLFIFPPPDATPANLNPDDEIITPASNVKSNIPPLGLRAHIECPHFEFHPTTPNTLIMSIKFKAVPWTRELATLMGEPPSANPPAEENVQETFTNAKGDKETKTTKKPMSHSKMSYLRSDGNAIATRVDGWTVSWEVSVQVKDIENLMDVVQASRNPQDSTLVTPEAEKQIEDKYKSVDTTQFTASSVFCLFETTQIASSFKLFGPDGAKPKNEEMAAMTLRISQYFGELHKQNDGKPTVDTPYLLGYGIKARTPKLETINLDLKTRTPTPEYFIPRRFDITTTPSKIDDDKKLTHGTLNFCMQTYRPNASDQIELQVTDEGKGRFEHPLFSIIKTPAFGLTGADGVMGFSRQIFRFWLSSFLDRFKANPTALLKDAADATDNLRPFQIDVNDFKKDVWQQGLGVTASTKFHGSAELDINKAPEGFARSSINTRRLFTGEATTLIKYTSDLLADPANAIKDVAHRRILLDFVFYYSLTGSFEGKYDDTWVQRYVAKLRSQYKIGYVLHPGEGGIWALTRDDSRTNVPAKGAETMKQFPTITEDEKTGEMIENPEPAEYTQMTLGSDKYGTVFNSGDVFASDEIVNKFKNNHNNEIPFVEGRPILKMVSSINASREVHLDDIENSMKGIFDSLKSTVILPAGNVFTFKTTDTDAAGNMYTSVTYRPAAELKKT